jgi:hypothetical protein
MFRPFGKLTLLIAVVLLSTRALAGDFQAVASTDKAWRPKGAHLTLGAALQVAEAEAVRNHMSFSNFQPPWFHYGYELYHYDNGEGYYVWVFTYEGKDQAPGNHFVVIVNDHTQRAELVFGQ